METMKGLSFILFCIFIPFTFAENFKFNFKEGDSCRINSYVSENVYINMNFSHKAEIVNRITADISDVKTSPETSALFTCTFMTSEKRNGQSNYMWEKQYPSVFRRNSLGVYDISKEYFMPVVRNVPVFPGYDVKAGESWKGTGHEAHDFRDSFGLQEPFIVPFDVRYTYVGKVEKDARTLDLIQAEYQLMYELPDEIILQNKAETKVFPITTLGSSKQNLYWDTDAGNLHSYDEEFSIRLILNSGIILDFVGTAYAQVTDIKSLDRKKTAEDLREKIDTLKLKNVSVKESEEGVTIAIENIHFLPDSAVLLDSEKEKLDKLADILKAYKERDLLITGHTALAGSKEGRDRLSMERANSVANYLIEKNVRERYRVFTKGYGAEKPLAPNDSEKNRAKNRRVEITIIDK